VLTGAPQPNEYVCPAPPREQTESKLGDIHMSMTVPHNFHSPDEVAETQKARLTDWIWEGSPVLEFTGKVTELFPQIPVFSRHPFRTGGEENRYKDEIRREPLKITEEPLPIATVSKTYSLIQHRELLAAVFRALKMIHIDISGLTSTLLLSEYGERMHWSCPIPDVEFDPGDGNPIVLRINCLNSVDTSTVLEIVLSWFRLVCSNGMMFGLGDSRLRRRHIQSLDPEDIARYLNDEFAHVAEEEGLYKSWCRIEVIPAALMDWVDGTLAKEWGPHAGARVWTIVNKGLDGEVEQTRNLKPHELPLTNTSAVPGSCAPVRNLFHISQALSWVAGTRRTISERLEYMRMIPALIEPLSHATKSASTSAHETR
jgi:hypothetical protein